MELTDLQALLHLLRTQGVTEFEGNGLRIRLGAPTQAEREVHAQAGGPVRSGWQSKVNPAYFHPALGLVDE